MSMPVFLDSSPYDHMPNGSQNEWDGFYMEPAFSLEANAFFPLFWLLLFSPENIKHAKYIDDYDVNDKDTQVERQRCFEEFGEQTYPYFVVSQQQGLKNLKDRKQAFLSLFEQDLSSGYRHFQELMEEHYPAFILLRTNGLDLNDHAEQNFRRELTAYAALGQNDATQDYEYWQSTKAEMQKYKNLTYFLQGTSYSAGYNNPPEPLENQSYVEVKSLYKDLPDFVYWIFGIIIGVPTVYIWIMTQSIIYAFIIFAVLAAIFSFITIKLTSKKT